MITNEELADKCIAYRAEHNLTMKQLAKMVGVSVITIFNIENQTHKPLATTAAKILKIINKQGD